MRQVVGRLGTGRGCSGPERPSQQLKNSLVERVAPLRGRKSHPVEIRGLEPSSCECVFLMLVKSRVLNLHSRIRRVHYVAQPFTDLGTAACSPFRTASMGGQHTSTVFAGRPSRNVSPLRRRVRGVIDPSSSTHVLKGKRTFQRRQKAVWLT